METKQHYKLYKSGKLWLCAAIASVTVALGMGLTTNASADSTTTTANVMTTQLTVVNHTSSTISQQNLMTASTVNNRITAQSTANNQVTANLGNLDQATMTANQQTGQVSLNVSGWHATGQSDQEQYRYVIVYDNTMRQEVTRQRVVPVQRKDVQWAHPQVDNSAQSGFNLTIALPNNVVTHSLSLVSRYSSDPIYGEGRHTDMWFGPIIVDNGNHAVIDNISSHGGQVTVSGWHATNQAAGKPYNYIIAYDQSMGREISRQQVTTGQLRPDVASAYATIGNAGIAGFNVHFNLTAQYARDNIQYISRWTDDPAGNGHAVDYWFSAVNKSNNGHLDSWNLSNGHLVVNGWHANDASIYEPNHYLILFDDTTNRQVASVKTENLTSYDVAKAYPGVRTAGQSRFNYDFGKLSLVNGHTYSLVSRYSNSVQGNGGTGNYTDYWYPAVTLNQGGYSIDGFTTDGNQLTVSGWFASDASLNETHPYVIFLADGHEVARREVDLTKRNDVANAYPQVNASLQSGFSATFTLPTNSISQYQFVLRFSDAENGEGHHTDMWTQRYVTNAGNFDQIQVNTNSVHFTGWHAAVGMANRPYQWLIVVDATNGHEYGRWLINQIGQTSQSRADVQRAYPWIMGSQNTGFSGTINDISGIDHHTVRFIHRYTDDPAGNGNAEDYYSGNVAIHSWYVIDHATYHMDQNGNIDYVLNDAPAICQRPNLPTGCEMTAVTMMLQYAGVNISKEQVANETPKSNNPYTGFMGNPYSNYGYGLWVAPSGIASVVARHLGRSLNMTGWSLDSIKNQLINRHLVVAWQSHMHGFGTHAITLTGFDGGGFFYNDPWTGQKNAHMTFGTFDWNWRDDPASRGALSY